LLVFHAFDLIKAFGGLSAAKKYLYKDLDGFKTSILRSRGGDNEYLYFIKDNKKIGKISEFVVKIATFAKPETVSGKQMTNHHNQTEMKNRIFIKLTLILSLTLVFILL
jgi:hypothetical protein